MPRYYFVAPCILSLAINAVDEHMAANYFQKHLAMPDDTMPTKVPGGYVKMPEGVHVQVFDSGKRLVGLVTHGRIPGFKPYKPAKG